MSSKVAEVRMVAVSPNRSQMNIEQDDDEADDISGILWKIKEDEHVVVGTHIVVEVLKEHDSSITFISIMGYQPRSGRFKTSASNAIATYKQRITERGKTQDVALEVMQRKKHGELMAMKKSQEEKTSI